jgi:hypothetical protein
MVGVRRASVRASRVRACGDRGSREIGRATVTVESVPGEVIEVDAGRLIGA